MDLEEWELLPDDGFLEIHDDGGKKIFSRKYGTDPKSVFNTNYFICPSPTKSPKFADPPANPRVPNQLVPVPIQLPETIGKESDQEQVKEVIKVVPIDQKAKKAPNMGAVEGDQDPVSQVFFKKMTENEFVDMKMDSPKSSTGRGIVPWIDPGMFQFEDRSEAYKGEAMEGKPAGSKIKIEKETVKTKKTDLDSGIEEGEEAGTWEEKNGGLNIWKWSLTGIGAICSFGVAAATICVIILGSHQKNKQQQQQQNQKLRFEIIADDKSIKQVVHHATKLNEAISAARGVPLTRAHITIGGYYDGL
ncbi:uncharacterized protein LOC130772359 [Actinidia eriantha]|uniref:uncharacterized protein LOC130772359 n=1 Tax=Actinidia eriantha TaxID=165200 RepID=UPI00258AE18D|nr:uncharacterized protein LOC130772359 [Actinidia eriantha]